MNDLALARALTHEASPAVFPIARARYWLGAIASILVAYLIAAWCHEFTHVLQAWAGTGTFDYNIDWNPTFNAGVCRGHFACAGADLGGFWLGEGLAYVVTAAVLVPGYLFLLPRFTGVRRP